MTEKCYAEFAPRIQDLFANEAILDPRTLPQYIYINVDDPYQDPRWRGRSGTERNLHGDVLGNGQDVFNYCDIGQGEYYNHRLVWAYHYGVWPWGDLIHIDENPANVKIENLRLVETTATYADGQPLDKDTAWLWWSRPGKSWRLSLVSKGKVDCDPGFTNYKAALAAARLYQEKGYQLRQWGVPS